MTPAEAGKILGISSKADIEQVKKQYRRLMLQVHPDVSGPSKARYQYSAQEINLAYGVLKKRLTGSEGLSFSGKGESSRKKNFHWDAPVNNQAWKERDVLHYAEDYEGNILGNFTIARGKYLWTTEEDFPLFLLSIYRCGQELLDDQGEKNDIQAVMEILHYYFRHKDVCSILFHHREHPAVSRFFDYMIELLDEQGKHLVKLLGSGKQDDLEEAFSDDMIHWFSHLQMDMIFYLMEHEMEEKQAETQVRNMVRFLRGGLYALVQDGNLSEIHHKK